MRNPDFFIIGAPRCGTTAMNDHLRGHPQVFIPDEKELHHFGADINRLSYHRDRGVYLARFEAARDAKRVGEASVWYIYSRLAAAEIFEFEPEARIIAMVRDPVEMIYSLHAKLLALGREDIPDFEKALAAEAGRKEKPRLPDGSPPVMPFFYREHAKLAPALGRYLDVFGPERVHVIVHDDLAVDPEGVSARVCEFLEIDPAAAPPLSPTNRHAGIRSLALDRFLANPPGWMRKLRRALWPGARPGVALKDMNTDRSERKPMSPELESALRREFAPHVAELGELIGRDLTHWSAPGTK